MSLLLFENRRISYVFLTRSIKTLKLDTCYNSELYNSDVFVHQFNSTIMNFFTAVRCRSSHELCLCLTKRPFNIKPYYLVLPFDSNLLGQMLWSRFSLPRHLSQILQLGATRFDLSIKPDFF